MKVELLTNLKLGDGRMIATGSVFSDKDAPIPDFIMRRLARRQARILEEKKSEVPTLKKEETEVVFEEKKSEAPTPKKEETEVVFLSKDKAVETTASKAPKTEKKKRIIR